MQAAMHIYINIGYDSEDKWKNLAELLTIILTSLESIASFIIGIQPLNVATWKRQR